MDAHDEYAGQRENVLSFGGPDQRAILFVQPFFEEGNRTRHIITKVMRAVSDAGFYAALPDLPGCGESVISLETVRLSDWHGALKSAAISLGTPAMVVSFRSGALIDGSANARHVWRCSPETGARMVRDLMRTRLTAGSNVETYGTITLAGNTLNKALLDELAATELSHPASLRVARLATDGADADVRLDGSPVWRRSEPGDDPALCASITANILTWAASCAAL